jgi:2'-5' RNA ligase
MENLKDTQEIKKEKPERAFLGFNFEEKYQNWYNKLCKDLSDEFNIKNLSKSNFLHITLKAPFDLEQKEINILKRKLFNIIKNKKIKFNIKGFDFFDGNIKTVYINTIVDKNSEADLQEILKKIKKIFQDSDNIESTQIERSVFNMHASIVRFLSQEELEKVLTYLEGVEIPFSEIKFDTINIYKKENIRETKYNIV